MPRRMTMKPATRWIKLHVLIIVSTIAVFGFSAFGFSVADARSFYAPPGAKTESKKREDARKRTLYNRHRARQMLHDDLKYREAESAFRYRDELRKLEIEKKRRELDKNR
jgi:hypothetical protein